MSILTSTIFILDNLLLFVAQIPVVNNLILFIWGWSIYLSILIYRDGFDVSTLRAILLGIGIPMIAVMITAAVVPEFISEAAGLWGLEAPAGDPVDSQ